jgi:hypothetical protein
LGSFGSGLCESFNLFLFSALAGSVIDAIRPEFSSRGPPGCVVSRNQKDIQSARPLIVLLRQVDVCGSYIELQYVAAGPLRQLAPDPDLYLVACCPDRLPESVLQRRGLLGIEIASPIPQSNVAAIGGSDCPFDRL